MRSPSSLTIGSRGSPLALVQARLVAAALRQLAPELEDEAAVPIKVIKTTGDSILDRPLAELGGKGLFTKEIEDELLAGTIDLAVHSMKDVPTVLPDGLVIGAVLARADPRDVLLAPGAARLAELPPGTVVGTASLRRAAQVRWRRPDLATVPLRGNVQTRLAKLERGEVGATLLAAAGLARLGLGTAGGVLLEPEELLPAVAQGAIGIECRADDVRTLELLRLLDHPATAFCIAAERALLATLDGSCRTPIAALATLDGNALRLRGLIASVGGTRVLSAELHGAPADAVAIGAALGEELLSRGAAAILGRSAA